MPKSGDYKLRYDILKLPYFVLTVSLLVTVGATYFFYQNALTKDRARFNTEVNKTRTIIINKLDEYKSVLRSTRAYIESDTRLDRKRFSIFVKNLQIDDEYADVQGVGYAEVTARKTNVLARLTAENGGATKIYPERPDNRDAVSFVVTYYEPFSQDVQNLIGFDMASENTRLEAMNRAIDSGQIQASGKITMMEENAIASHPGFIFFLPIYKGGNIPATIEERRSLISGFAFGVFRADAFLSDIQKTIAANYLSVMIYDNEEKQENLLVKIPSAIDSSFSAVNEIEVANRRWIVEYDTLSDFELQSSMNLTPLIFLSGLIFSLLLFGMTYLESHARVNSEKIADTLRESESEKARLLESEQKARETAERANLAKDEFIANVSHELRTPLNSIAGWSKILQKDDISSEMKKRALQTIEKNLRTQTKIIEDLLDFSQITQTEREKFSERFKFSEVFEEAYLETENIAREKGVFLKKDNCLDGQEVLGNPTRLKKVVKNLLSNAVKFTPKGGNIMAMAKIEDDYIAIKVADNGQGINPTFLPYIFEHFKQADSSITRQHGGLGMGLAISQRILENHGGKIEAISEGEGKGTIFIAKIPYLHEDRKAVVPERS